MIREVYEEAGIVMNGASVSKVYEGVTYQREFDKETGFPELVIK